MSGMTRETALPFMEAIVPFMIHEMAERGGPTQADRERLETFRDGAFQKADAAQFRSETSGKERDEVSGFWTEVAHCLAVLAFCPGGVQIFGGHWSAGMPDLSGKRTQVAGCLGATLPFLDTIAAESLGERGAWRS